MTNDHGGKPDGEFDGKTFVYVRTHPADDGSTPLAPGLPWWVSPDITIIRPGGIRGSEAGVGESDQVEVVVTNNGGIDAIDAHVEAFVADPSTAFTPAAATLVGSGFLTIPNYSQTPIVFPWTPMSSDAGHRCLLARVCLSMPFDCYANASVFDVPGDRHVAQRNIEVVKMEKKMLSFGFLVVNASQKGSAFLLRASEVRLGRNIEFVRRALGCSYAQFGEVAPAGFGLFLGKSMTPERQPGEGEEFPTGLLNQQLELPRRKSASLEMKPGERRHAVLTVARNPDIRPGDLRVVQVEQIDIKTRRSTGGLWIVIQH